MEAKPKIALVKQEIYDDLYVCGVNVDAEEALYSTFGRVGPIGLFTRLDVDFYIVKEEWDAECQVYRKINPTMSDAVQVLKKEPINHVKGMEFHIPGTDKTHADFSVYCDEVDWDQYDIVISLNISVPKRVIRKFCNTLWVYMIGEIRSGSLREKYNYGVFHGYDFSLNQLARGRENPKMGMIDFPYTFMGKDCMASIIKKRLGRDAENDGIFVEINSCEERPVKSVPKAFMGLGDFKFRLHQQRIADNLRELYDAKYFIKWGGRKIRGNSVVEAISAGTLVIANRDDFCYNQAIQGECDVKSLDEIKALLVKLENNDEHYKSLLEEQQSLVEYYFYQKPVESLIKAYKQKFGNFTFRK